MYNNHLSTCLLDILQEFRITLMAHQSIEMTLWYPGICTTEITTIDEDCSTLRARLLAET